MVVLILYSCKTFEGKTWHYYTYDLKNLINLSV